MLHLITEFLQFDGILILEVKTRKKTLNKSAPGIIVTDVQQYKRKSTIYKCQSPF
jgi:hypothetical protein